MALTNKRIIDLPQRTILRSDDYVAVDSSDGGTAKYNITELETAVNDVAPIIVNTSDTASVIAFADGAEDMPIKALRLNLIPHQSGSGDPSPSNIRPISGHTSINVTRTGENLLNVTATSRTYNGITMTVNEDDTITANGTATATAAFYLCDLTDAFSEGTYVLNGCPSGGTAGGYDLRMYQGSSGFAYDKGDGATFTGRSNVRVGLVVNNGKTVNNLTFKPMIRLASISDPTFEPYQSDTYPITLPQTVYGGELDVVSGKLKVTHRLLVLNGSEGFWSNTSTASNVRRFYTDTSYSGIGLLACDSLKINVDPYTTNNIYVSGGRLTVTPDWAQSITTIADFKTALAAHPITIVQTTTPTEITLDPVTIKTLLGTNVIWMSADGTIQADYCADTKMYIDALTAPDEDMVANTNIASGKYFTVNNKLYISTSAIAQGEQIVVGTNCNQTDLATALNAINA